MYDSFKTSLGFYWVLNKQCDYSLQLEECLSVSPIKTLYFYCLFYHMPRVDFEI